MQEKDGPAQSTLTPSEQLDAYMNETVKDEGDPVLHWWARKGNIAYLALAHIVRELLAVCATSLRPNMCSLPVELWSHTSVHVSQHKALKH